MQSPDLILALEPVIGAFNRLGISYAIGGSVGGSIYGLARATLDIDLVADIKATHVDDLARELREQYYIDEAMIRSAIVSQATFNLVHLKTMIKLDIFVLKNRKFDLESFRRRTRSKLHSNIEYDVVRAEDLILHKLEWYEKGGRISERQWSDILGILRVQGNSLDHGYLEKWARELGLTDLLEKIISQI